MPKTANHAAHINKNSQSHTAAQMKETNITQIIAQIIAQRQHSQMTQSHQPQNSELTQNKQVIESATMSQIVRPLQCY